MPIELDLGDIVRANADAIVNAANSQLAPGGGVCGAIHAAAGPKLADACAAWVASHGPVPAGAAAITDGYALPARWVVHAVGPVWHGGREHESETLASAYAAAIEAADSAGAATIALPSISTGIYGFPVELAAPVALRAVAHALERADHVSKATFVLYDRETFDVYALALAAG